MEIREENFDAIVERFRGFINKKKNTWWVPGADPDDLEQEIKMIVLNCIRRWDPSRGVPFWAYLQRAVQNRLHNLSGRAQRRKHLMAEFSLVRLGEDVDPVGDEPWMLQVADMAPGPDEVAAGHEFIELVASLSPTCEAVVAQLLHGEERGVTREDILEARKTVRQVLGNYVIDWRQGLRRPVVSERKVIGWRPAYGPVKTD